MLATALLMPQAYKYTMKVNRKHVNTARRSGVSGAKLHLAIDVFTHEVIAVVMSHSFYGGQ